MTINKVLETSLYVDELERSAAFYEKLFGLDRLIGDERFRAYSVNGEQVLLLFVKGTALAPLETPSGIIPPHDGAGRLHLAFSIEETDLDGWREKLAAEGVPIESEAKWPRGGTSLYFRDPDGPLVELITPGCWSSY